MELKGNIYVFVHKFIQPHGMPFCLTFQNKVNAPINEHLRLMNEHYYKIMFAARLLPPAAKTVWTQSKKLKKSPINYLIFNNLFY